LLAARDALAAVVTALHGDDALAAAVAEARVVVLGAMFRLIRSAADRPAAPPPEPPGLARAQLSESVGGAATVPSAYAVAATLPTIAAGARAAGAVNHYRDDDGVARRMPLVIEFGGRYYQALALTLASLATKQPTRFVAAERAVHLGERALPTTARLNFLGRPFPRVSAAAILDGRERARLRGAIAIVGFTHAAYDKVPTPFAPVSDGVELHATLLHNLLYDELLRDAGPVAGVAAMLGFVALAVALQLRRVRRRLWLPLVAAVLAIVGWLALGQALFARGIAIELVAPVTAFALTILAATVATLTTEGREKAALRGAFAQYVSRSLVERIVANPSAARLGGERRDLTVLFSDIRGFSRIAESLPPEGLADFLNEYLTPMTAIVLDSDGTLDKYIGDAVMAMWNAPVDVTDHPTRACAAALGDAARAGPPQPGVDHARPPRDPDRHRHQHRPDVGRQHGQRGSLRLHGAGRRGQPGGPPRAADQGVRRRRPGRRGDRGGGPRLRVPRAGAGADEGQGSRGPHLRAVRSARRSRRARYRRAGRLGRGAGGAPRPPVR
jgi:adenylate cyclase